MRKALYSIALIILTAIVIVSCSKDDTDKGNTLDCSTTPKTFATDANPLIQTYCNQAACHEPGSTNGPGPLTNYTQIFNARMAIRGAVEANLMPQNTTLTLAQKNIILCWIDNGAPNN